MARKSTITLGILLFIVGSSKCQVTLPDKPLAKTYLCAGVQTSISCPYGFAVEIQDGMEYGVITGGCTKDTVDDESKQFCVIRVYNFPASFQKAECKNQARCKVYDLTGTSTGCIELANFMVIPYICRFVGYDGMSPPPPTTSTTATQKPITTVPSTGVTTQSTGVTTQSTGVTSGTATVSTDKSTGNKTDAPNSTSGPSTSMTPNSTSGPSTSMTSDVTSPGKPATAAQTEEKGLSARDKQIVIGVSVAAVALILFIILLVECKRQARQKRKNKNKTDSAKDNVEEPIVGDATVVKDPPSIEHSDHTIDVDDEIAIINKEPERRFRKRNEVYEDTTIIAPVAKHAVVPEESALSESVHSGRDSGVSALYSEEGTVDAKSPEQPEEEKDDDEEDDSHETEEQSKPVRRVTFNDQAMNTDMTAIDKDTNSTRSSSTSSSNPKPDEHPPLDRTISGPGSEREVLY